MTAPRFYVRCSDYRTDYFRTREQAEKALAGIIALGKCLRPHEIVVEQERTHVVSMSTRRIHRFDCRYVHGAGSRAFPFADDAAVAALPHCRTCCANESDDNNHNPGR